ncbi:MAG: family 20 glycosylhydrolase [Saprospiraceae bacterium]|nr:family 20 glycosylhydrolase [Saprospiraceae bacterium]
MQLNQYLLLIFLICFSTYAKADDTSARTIQKVVQNHVNQQNRLNLAFSHSIIPQPLSIRIAPGFLKLSEVKQIIIPENNNEIKLLARLYQKSLNLPNVKIVESKSPKPGKVKSIVLQLPFVDRHPDLYTIQVNKTGIQISAQLEQGLFYGLQSLIQLSEQSNFIKIPFLVMEDQSEFSYRGMHLDVSRHFFTTDFIKQYLDLLARYKFNKFHWHLTDDQGWRIEIKKYPLLTEVGSIRKKTLIGAYGSNPVKYDDTEYGGFYTQEEIKEIVRYAKERYIEIIPEIEMPGHSAAILAAYPHLSCNPAKSYGVATTWGVSDNTLCPTDTTLMFMKDVLNEVCELFPGKLIHIGGDEVVKDVWKNSQECSKIMQRQKLKNYEELQSYFIKQMDLHLTKKGKTLIGWDEILEGGLSQNAVVMSWRGTEGGIAAANQKHDVVMCPGTHCYFDHYQSTSMDEPLAIGGYTSLEKVYSFQPVPSELKPEFTKYILGSQGNVWTEYIPTNEQALYMAFPRAIALAEVNWTKTENKDYKDFLGRLKHHFAWFSRNNINLSQAYLDLQYKTNLNQKGLFLYFTKPPVPGKILMESKSNEEGLFQEYLHSDSINLLASKEFKCWYQLADHTLGRSLSIQYQKSKSTASKLILINQPSKKYSSGGSIALINGIDAPENKFSGVEWLGFDNGSDLEAFLELEKADSISRFSIQVFQEESSWIYMPSKIELLASEDGKNYQTLKIFEPGLRPGRSINLIMNLDKPVSSRYWKILVKNYGIIPTGVPGEGKGAWLFVGELRLD